MKFSRFFHLPVLLFLMGFIFSCDNPVKYERPIDTWVFRSVMDLQPRMLTVALNKDLYACYNLQSGSLYKVWKGGVNYEGAVYTTAHGVQPTSYGFAYLQDDSPKTQWRLKNGDRMEVPKINYLGYTMIDGQVGIDFELLSENGESIKIREIPEYGQKDNRSGLVRTFEILEGAPDNLVPVLGYSLEEGVIFKETISGGNREGGSELLEVGKKTTVSTYFNPVVSDWKTPVADDTGMIAAGMKLAEQSDCMACHLVHENLVGPAYDSIAKRYPFDWASIDMLADKIIMGGTGNWGAIAMTAHPDMSKSDAQNMAYYILSLDEEPEPSERTTDIALNTPDIIFDLDNVDRTGGDKKTKQAGAAVNFYLQNDGGDLYDDLTKSSLPIMNGIAPAIHLPTSGILGEIQENFYMEFKGYIKSDEEIKKTFRLISDDGSVLNFNGTEIIDNRGSHAAEAVDAQVVLKKGWNEFLLQFHQGG